jgi:hypothetical protein
MSMYSVVGVEYFGQHGPGAAYFSNFGQGMFTLLGVATLEGWVDVVQDMTAMDMGQEKGGTGIFDNARSLGVMIYFVTFVALVGYIVTSVVVAILLDNYNQVRRDAFRFLNDAGLSVCV